MRTKPFDAATWSPEKKYVARDGTPLRVLAIDLPGSWPVAAAEIIDNTVALFLANRDGFSSMGKDSDILEVLPDPAEELYKVAKAVANGDGGPWSLVPAIEAYEAARDK